MRVRDLFIILHFLFISLSFKVFPQNYLAENKIQFKRLTHQEGFPARNILCMLQDSKGFLWMAGPDRLIRFDGKRQKLFRYSGDDKNSIGSNTVRAMLEDKNGILWFGATGGGLNRYNSVSENFTRYFHNPQDPNSISSNDVSAICEDIYGNLWIGTLGGGLNMFDRKSQKYTVYKNVPSDVHSLSNNNVSVIYEDSEHNLWIGTAGGGLNHFDNYSKKFTRFIHNPADQNSLSNNNITGILEDKNGYLWISTMGGGLNRFNYSENNKDPVFAAYKSNPEDQHSLSSNNISCLYLDREKILWIGTDDGISKMVQNPLNSSLRFITYRNDKFDIFSLIDNMINCIYEDNSGMLWISTGGAGLHVYDKREKKFQLYANEPNNKYSLSATAVMSVYEDKAGTRWIGMRDGGLNKMEKGSNKFIHYRHNPADPNSLSNNNVSSIFEDRRGILWVGSLNGGLNKFNRKTGKFITYKHDPLNDKSISDNRILSIIEDKSGKLWIGTVFGGLNQFNRDDETFIHYRFDPEDSNSISSDYVSELYCDKSGNLLVATKEGLDQFDEKNKKFIHFDLNQKSLDKTRNTRVTALYQQMNGTLWIGTYDKGLIKYQSGQGIIKSYTVKDGLPIDYITGILDDDHGNLWVSTTIGVSKIDPDNQTVKTYIYEDGIQGMGELTPCKSKSGELIFGGVMGLSIFHPDSISDYTHLPPVYFTDLYLFNKRIPIGYDSLMKRSIIGKSLIETEELILGYDDNVITLDFAILDFHSLFKWNKFAYKLEGFNSDWIYSETGRSVNNRSVTFTNLSPGEYTLKVKAANSDDIWNDKYASLKIIILPPWYRNIWAYLTYIVFFGSIIYFFWKSQIKRIRVKQEIEISKIEARKIQEVDKIKSRFFANISHEFRTPLTLILGPAKDIIENTKETRNKLNASLIKRNAVRLLGLVNQLLDISKLESGTMKLQASPRNIIQILKELVQSFTPYAERKRITLKLFQKEDEVIVYTDKDKFEKIIANILSNALKFTPGGGIIDINVSREERFLRIRISDTGIGIPQDRIEKIFDRFYQVDGSHTREHEGTGLGLSLTRELVELHKGRIEVESEPGKGSAFTVILPLGKDHLSPEEICEAKEEKEEIPEKTGIEEKEEKFKPERIDAELVEKNALPLLLIIEDNPDVRTYIRNNLKTDYRIIEAENGKEGWDKSIQQIPDLIISDVMMPKMDGFMLCEMLKSDERTSHIPVILLTAKAAKEDRLNGFGRGADEYLMKPFDTDELRVRIKNLIEQRKRLHRHFKTHGLAGIEEQTITSTDKLFLQRCLVVINKHISDPNFSVEIMAEEMSLSRSGLQKKIHSLAGETPGELIRRIRLNRAAELIKNNHGNISEISLEVGYSNPAHFAETFKKQFGVIPSQFQQKNNNI